MGWALITLIDSHAFVEVCDKASAGFRGQKSVKTITIQTSVSAKELPMLVYWFLMLSIKEFQMGFGTSLYDSLRILGSLIIKWE